MPSGTHLIDTICSGAAEKAGYIKNESRGAHAGWTIAMPIGMGSALDVVPMERDCSAPEVPQRPLHDNEP